MKCPRIEVRRVGQVERWNKKRRSYQWADGFAVFVDGREYVPHLLKREAVALARSVAGDVGCPRMRIPVKK